METLPDRDGASTDELISPQRQLAPGGSPLGRMAEHTRAIVNDLTSWIDLRIELAQIEMEERLEDRLNKLVVAAIMGALAALTGLFALLFVSFFLGWLLGNTFWGFLIVTILLGLATVVVRAAKPQLVDLRRKRPSKEDEMRRDRRTP